ncbi:cell wall metabolism sensor histidine kinase WalK [Sporosarcina pasteurii]|nr:HAMP domain-containing sensor histidine kinase [Sporosarcina pasteurii]MDS9472428.1 HAMP domain-containing sensor histidine kinase [Sporosarcina pasteurii]
MKIRTKIHLFSTLLMFVILILTNTGVYFLFEKMAYDTERKQLQSQVKEITASFSKMTAQNDPAVIIRAHLPDNGVISVAGQRLGSGEATTLLKDYTPTFTNDSYTVEKINGTSVLSVSSPVIWNNGDVVQLDMMQLLVNVDRNLMALKLVLAGVTLLAMLPVVFSSIGLSRIVINPIEKLIATMSQSRKSGTYEKIQMSVDRKDEMAQMALTFNEMMEQLEQNYKQQEQFVSNASHELKTPLTVIESYARLLTRRGFDNRDVAEEAVGAILSESVRMKSMIEQLLQLAKNDEQATFQFEETDLFDQIEKTVKPMRQAYARQFDFEGIKNAIVLTDSEKFRQLLYIFLDNARKYSEDLVKVAMQDEGDGYSIAITDYGNGIPQEALPHVFNRFYRVEEDRNRKTGGTGLGLAIAKQLADGLGAGLKMESISGMGTTVRITIPKRLDSH